MSDVIISFCQVLILNFIFRVEQPPEDGVFVHGLFIEGAKWDKLQKSVVEQDPKAVIYKFPVIHFIVTSKPIKNSQSI